MTILAGTPATIQATYLEGETVADPGTVTVTVRRATGEIVKGPETAGGVGAAPRTTNLSAVQTAQLDMLAATWESPTHGVGIEHHEIVGEFYVELATLRAERDLADATVYTLADLEEARRWWRDLVDDYCGQSFIPRFRLDRRWWRGGILRLERPHVRQVRAATLDGEPLDVTGWTATPTGRIYTPATLPAPGVLEVAYTHGHDRPDSELYEVGVTAMRSKIMTDRSGRASRQVLLSNQLGTVRLAQPGADRPTGIPDVDATLKRRKYGLAMVG